MTAAPATKGWCPTLLSPMESGDGWLARVKPSAGVLSADAARVIAGAARRYGNGHIDLTSRGNVQVRGLSPRSAEYLAEAIIDAGLASANASFEAIRNVMASPLGPDDPSDTFDSHAVARDIEAMLIAEPALWGLPSKFAFVVDAGGELPLVGITADVAVRAHGGQLSVQLDGGSLGALCDRSSIADTVKAVTLALLQLLGERSEMPRRTRTLVKAVGEEAILAGAGLVAAPLPLAQRPEFESPIGLISFDYPADGAFGIGLPFGRIDADALASLAALAERYGDGTLRTTPWRALLLIRISPSDAGKLSHEVRALELIAESDDPRLNIFACVGGPSCQSASVNTRGDAGRLASVIGVNDSIHVSGCSKSCAHRGAALLTLVGRDGRYDAIRNGSAADRPSLTGLSVDQVAVLIQSVRGQCP